MPESLYYEKRSELAGLASGLSMTDVDLEDELERMNDEIAVRSYGGHSGFDNYMIKG